jgi:hypothetical protein
LHIKKTVFRAVSSLMVAGLFGVGMPAAIAQSDASALSGAVTDASGAVLPNAKVHVHNDATRADYDTSSNGQGSFNITNLTPGDYSIRVEMAGFQTTTLSNIHVDASIGRHVDIPMKVGDTNTEINVEAGANAIQTESASVGQLVTQDQVKSIQLNGRNPLYLSQLEPASSVEIPWRPWVSV